MQSRVRGVTDGVRVTRRAILAYPQRKQCPNESDFTKSKSRKDGGVYSISAIELEITKQKPSPVPGTQQDQEITDDTPGWCWFADFCQLDPNDITLDVLEELSTPASTSKIRRPDENLEWTSPEDWICSKIPFL